MGRFSYLEQKNQVTKILRQKKRRKGVADQMRTEVRNKPVEPRSPMEEANMYTLSLCILRNTRQGENMIFTFYTQPQVMPPWCKTVFFLLLT